MTLKEQIITYRSNKVKRYAKDNPAQSKILALMSKKFDLKPDWKVEQQKYFDSIKITKLLLALLDKYK